jgi:phosphate/sulfate permease
VGAKSLTIKQAIVIAAIFEFSGALLLGSDVMNTVRKDIADATCFQDNPPLLMHGMMCALYVAFLSLYLQIHVLFIYDYANSKIIITGTLLDSGFCLRVISRCPSVQLTRLLVLLLV